MKSVSSSSEYGLGKVSNVNVVDVVDVEVDVDDDVVVGGIVVEVVVDSAVGGFVGSLEVDEIVSTEVVFTVGARVGGAVFRIDITGTAGDIDGDDDDDDVADTADSVDVKSDRVDVLLSSSDETNGTMN